VPIYEYYCEPCNGIFEELRPMRESSEPVPCPECFKDAGRIMPTSFAAFTFRDGYPRRIPDDGKFYHLGHKVSKPITGGRPNEHPEVNKPEPEPTKLKGEISALNDMADESRKGRLKDGYGNQVEPEQFKDAVSNRRLPSV
jgi:putative FmdB family regulatory protein